MSEPADKPGECNAHLHIADDYGDNHGTMRCQRPSGHTGTHMELYGDAGRRVKVIWEENERGGIIVCAPREEAPFLTQHDRER